MTRTTQRKAALEIRTSRDAALAAAHTAFSGEGYAAGVIGEMRRAGGLSARDLDFSQELALGAVRRALTLRHIVRTLAPYDEKRTAPIVQSALLIGAYQLVCMGGVPDFAAVNETVATVRRFVNDRAASMINAVLRRVAGGVVERGVAWTGDDTALVRTGWSTATRFNSPVLPETSSRAEHLSAATGQRTAYFQQLAQTYGDEPAAAISWASQAAPAMFLHPNRLKFTPDEFAAAVRSEYGDAADMRDGCAALAPGAGVAASGHLREGQVFVQDASAAAAARAAQAAPGQRVLDLCAAPGGKTCAMALDMENRGEIVACDVSADRIARVRQNAERLGLTCVQTVVLDAATADLTGRLGAFDVVLVDAPCSNSGVIARRPEARFRLDARNMQMLVNLQARLLQQAAGCVKPGGSVVYSTCSIESVENRQLVEAFLATGVPLTIEADELTLPAWGPRPGDWRDGGYWTRLRRQ
ncbi:Ribosomal RNA small subunit methyltransferase B [Phycisphaerae bacterium RAS1]|nr:Ribosomal RNA small subunit methyltransferase B [Phycisphaerae bacterium RAS1]